MSFVKNVRWFPAKTGTHEPALLLCGFGGSVWQVRRLILTLNANGYDVTVLDFSSSVLRTGDPSFLPALVDEVVAFAETEDQTHGQPLLVGVSLGALLVLNIVRRSKRFNGGVLITGGDIVKIARKLFPRAWRPLPFETHAALWRNLNMYSDPNELAGKRLLFVLPKKDRLVNKSDLRREIAAQHAAGNELHIIERRALGHFGTIIEETILFPRRTLGYIKRVRGDTMQA